MPRSSAIVGVVGLPVADVVERAARAARSGTAISACALLIGAVGSSAAEHPVQRRVQVSLLRVLVRPDLAGEQFA